jgi:hypothetical protein
MPGDPPVGPSDSDEGEDFGSSLDHAGRHRGDEEESIACVAVLNESYDRGINRFCVHFN